MRLAFVHASSTQGIGEYVRCLALGHAIRADFPDAEVLLIGSSTTPRLPDDPFARAEIAAPLSRPAGLRELRPVLSALRPDLVYLDNTATPGIVALARELGARVVALAARPSQVRRATRLGVLYGTDELWVVQQRAGARVGAVRALRMAWERWKARLAGTPRIDFDFIARDATPTALAAERARLGVEPGAYTLYTAGGGGQAAGRTVGGVMREAAERAVALGAGRAWVVLGPLHDAPAAASTCDVRCVASLPPLSMAALIDGATVVVTTAGGTLVQALARGRPCVGVTGPGSDQGLRLRELARCGAVHEERLDPEAIARSAAALILDDVARSRLAAAADELAYRNGVQEAARRLTGRARD